MTKKQLEAVASSLNESGTRLQAAVAGYSSLDHPAVHAVQALIASLSSAARAAANASDE